MGSQTDAMEDGFSVVIRPRGTLASGQRWQAFAAIAGVSIAVSAAVAAAGAWPALPFAGAEVALLYWAFREFDRRAGCYERIAVAGDKVRVEWADGRAAGAVELSRHLTRVEQADERSVRVLLRSHGRAIEVGRLLPAGERLALKRRLQQHLAPAWR